MTHRPPQLNRRHALALGAGLALSTATIPAWAQSSWPSRSIRLMVNFPAGGSADAIARPIAAVLAESLGQPVVVVNRAGASGNLGASEAARSAAGDYTMLFSPGSTMISNPFLFSQMPFDTERDVIPLASVARLSLFLMVHPSVPANNVQELVAHIRANPTRLNYGSNGQGSSPHLAAEMMLRQAGLQASHVPYRGTAPALAALLSGEIQFMFDSCPGLPHAAAGRLRLLGVGSPARAAQFPNVPTLAESGFPGFDVDTLFGIYMPSGTPAPLLDRLHQEVNRTLTNTRVQEAIRALGAEPMALSRQAFAERMTSD
ncbi:MAG: ABC transporter substrate-binding protein, partial [Burkholderiales bacterium 34-67-9]